MVKTIAKIVKIKVESRLNEEPLESARGWKLSLEADTICNQDLIIYFFWFITEQVFKPRKVCVQTTCMRNGIYNIKTRLEV